MVGLNSCQETRLVIGLLDAEPFVSALGSETDDNVMQGSIVQPMNTQLGGGALSINFHRKHTTCRVILSCPREENSMVQSWQRTLSQLAQLNSARVILDEIAHGIVNYLPQLPISSGTVKIVP